MSQFGPTPSVATPQPLYARYVHGDETIDFTPDAGTDYGAGVGNGVPFGAVLVIGAMIAISVRPLPAGIRGALAIEGSFSITKAASDGGMAAGSIWYWDDTGKVATGTAGSNKYGGKVEIAALTADTSVRVQLESLANASGSIGFGSIPSGTVAATGSTVSDAAALANGFNLVTAADGTKGVVLPTAPGSNTPVIVKNNSASALKVWPDAAATINAIASHANISLAANTIAVFYPSSTTQWWTHPLLPS